MTNEFPLYPRLTPHILPFGEYEKLDLTDLMAIYDELTALGLYVMPKLATSKVPHRNYWGGEVRLDDRKQALRDQQSEDISGWCVAAGDRSDRLIVLDFDTKAIEAAGYIPADLYLWVQSISPSAFVLGSPSGGCHVYYKLPAEFEMIGNVSPPVKGLDVRGNKGQVVTLGGFNRYDNTASVHEADKKGVPSGHSATYSKLEGGDYSAIPEMSKALYDWLTSTQKTKVAPKETEGERYSRTTQGQARIEEHLKQPMSDQERVVLECLGYVLAEWNSQGYDEWLQMWMSAHHGSNGSSKARDFILEHPNVPWSDGAKGRQAFRERWDRHSSKEEGYTVASLFYLARQAGWLTQTGYEISDRLTERINVRYVTEWFDKLTEYPKRLLLISQTGSGKTYGFKKLWLDLGKPKAVIFVPSVRLATELAQTLKNEHGLPVTLYIDNETGRRKQALELVDAPILVTTLQSFATKIHAAGIPMSRYGLVYLEECNQLLEGFARGGGGLYSSHVSEREARAGFAVVREAFAESAYVWGVDATMTRVTYDAAEAMRGHQSVKVVKNAWVEPKAPVTFVDSKEEAYQLVLQGLEEGERVVVAADTAGIAEEVVAIMREIGALEGKRSLVITRSTERDPEAIHFMDDVNAGAALYDLVAYNSAMASGVSIDKVKPDRVVQICTYLTPRVNLQILNRYRMQPEAVYCYYRAGDNIYAKEAAEVLSDAERRALLESGVVNIPLAARSDDAVLRAHITSLAVGDEHHQRRAARDFYRGLLQSDGRVVTWQEDTAYSDAIDEALDVVRQMRADRREFLATTWPLVPPIDRERPALPSYTQEQVDQGIIHAHIERVLRGSIPEGVPPKEVYDVVQAFSPYSSALTAFVNQEDTLRRSETYLADRGKALTSLSNHITLVRVLATLHHLYYSLDEELSADLVTARAPDFMKSLWSLKDEYDSISHRAKQTFQEVYDRSDNDADRAVDFSKILLKRLGLKQKSNYQSKERRIYSISNLEDAKKFLEWRKSDLVLTDAPVMRIIEQRQSSKELYEAMTPEQQQRVMTLLLEEKFTNFQVAVKHVSSGLDPY